MPEVDRDRANYQIQTSKLAQLYIKGLGISEENEAAVRLKNWKDPNKAGARGKVHATGDFSVILEEICGGRYV